MVRGSSGSFRRNLCGIGCAPRFLGLRFSGIGGTYTRIIASPLGALQFQGVVSSNCCFYVHLSSARQLLAGQHVPKRVYAILLNKCFYGIRRVQVGHDRPHRVV
ncbi:hypothetical protein UA18_00388 [Burkholderia multivorans]|uniref:Uncharacterized protein n=1 Tax=Burkholderia multivorans TaxID=87883 RepID=A0ABD7LFG6_9BURK|nr:hypothetical protein UA18_00388 [Burkholderia multivorans]SAK13748.1 hypothetical protein UA17_00724 [Burkholderia multivorans]